MDILRIKRNLIAKNILPTEIRNQFHTDLGQVFLISTHGASSSHCYNHENHGVHCQYMHSCISTIENLPSVKIDAVFHYFSFVRGSEKAKEASPGFLPVACLALVQDHDVLPAVLREVEGHGVANHTRPSDDNLHR